MRPRLSILGTGLLALCLIGACRNVDGPPSTETWAADLTSTRQVLFMTFPRGQATVSGTGSLASLTSPGGEQLTLAGSRRVDTLDITFTRTGGGQFRFFGWYLRNASAITGTLNGGEFVNLSVGFRSR